jgi:hypothetical protein
MQRACCELKPRTPLTGITAHQRALAQTGANRMPLRAFWFALRPRRATWYGAK